MLCRYVAIDKGKSLFPQDNEISVTLDFTVLDLKIRCALTEGIGRFSVEGFPFCASTVPLSAVSIGKQLSLLRTALCSNQTILLREISLNGQPIDLKLVKTCFEFVFTRYVRRRVWKFLEGPCTPRARTCLLMTVRFCAEHGAIFW